MKGIAFIFARGGSKGLPGKNIKPLGGKPLIAWSIEHARQVERIDRIIVSTDSEEIIEVAREWGAEAPFVRPAELAGDESPEWLAWRHALEYVWENDGTYPEMMISVPATAPLRNPEDIDKCIDEYEKGNVDVVITVTESHRNPYFNMVKINPDMTVGLVNPPGSTIYRRQDAPVVYDMATVAYVVRPDFVMSKNGIFDGRVRSVLVPVERAIDIDTPLDFRIAECILGNRGQFI